MNFREPIFVQRNEVAEMNFREEINPEMDSDFHPGINMVVILYKFASYFINFALIPQLGWGDGYSLVAQLFTLSAHTA